MNIAGKVNGKNVAWSYTTVYNGTTLTMKHTGILDSGKVTGTVQVAPFGMEGEFTATLASDSAIANIRVRLSPSYIPYIMRQVRRVLRDCGFALCCEVA